MLVNGHQSDIFPIDQGVGQGDPLSPTLYAIFDNELLETLHSGEDASVSFMAGTLALMYADDLVVFATSASDLQEKGISHVLSMLGNTDTEQMLLSLGS